MTKINEIIKSSDEIHGKNILGTKLVIFWEPTEEVVQRKYNSQEFSVVKICKNWYQNKLRINIAAATKYRTNQAQVHWERSRRLQFQTWNIKTPELLTKQNHQLTKSLKQILISEFNVVCLPYNSFNQIIQDRK